MDSIHQAAYDLALIYAREKMADHLSKTSGQQGYNMDEVSKMIQIFRSAYNQIKNAMPDVTKG